MREDSSISHYRGRLDKTLSSSDLVNLEALGTLVKDQILRSSEKESEEYLHKIVESRTKEVSTFLSMLRSASAKDVQRSKYIEASHGSWKVKQDTEEFRVMYREGPEGTPFHTLLVEGYVDGPLDVCLCISWEAGLYPKWWPQITLPSFKILSSQCLKKVRIGEQICLVRMKLSWPLSTREALLHYFEFEYFQDDLVVMLFNSISDLESIDRSTHGFTREGIPDAEDVVRIDVVGGFALQKVSAHRSYFRTIANMDVKLDFVPPAFINFVSRQLIGSGFKLYKKEVASASKGDEDFGKALEDPLYTRIGEALYSNRLSSGAPQPEDPKNDTFLLLEEQPGGKDEVSSILEVVHNDDLAANPQAGDSFVQDKKYHGEIEEIKENDSEESECLAEDGDKSCNLPTDQIDTSLSTDNQKVVIRPEVEQALRMLDKVISVLQEYKSNDKTRFLPGVLGENLQNLENDAAKESVSLEAEQICRNAGSFAQLTVKEGPETIASYELRNSSGSHDSRCTGSTSYSRDANHNKRTPASPDKDVPSPKTHHASQNQRTESTFSEKIVKEDNVVRDDANGIGGNKVRSKNSKPQYCCFHSRSWQ